MTLRFEQTAAPDSADVESVRAQLQAYNRQHAGPFAQQNLAVFARDEQGEIVGGAAGELTWGWLYVDLLWVHEAQRGAGLGSELLARLEKLADGYGVVGYHLGTASFQALDFYLRCGYEVWGQLRDFPPGHTNYSLAKRSHSARASTAPPPRGAG